MTTLDNYGRDAVLHFRRQTDFATAAVTADGSFVNLRFFNFSMGSGEALEAREDLNRGLGREPHGVDLGLINPAMQMEVPGDYDELGWHLYGMFGAPTTTGTDPYTHAFASGGTTQTFHTFVASMVATASDLWREFSGGIYNEFSASLGRGGQRQRFRFGLLGHDYKKVLAAGDDTPLDTASGGFSQWRGKLKIDDTDTGLIETADFTVSNNLELDQLVTGTRNPGGVLTGLVSASGNFNLRTRNNTHFDASKAGTNISLAFEWVTSAGLSLTVAFPAVRLTPPAQTVQGPGVISQAYAWTADAPSGSDAAVEVTLINSRADYDMPA